MSESRTDISSPIPAEGDAVEFLHEDEPGDWLWHGHPGRVIGVIDYSDGNSPNVCVTFPGGPSLEMVAGQVGPLSIDDYTRRVDRLRRGRHPISEMELGRPLAPIREDE